MTVVKIDLSNKNFLVTGSAGFGVGSGICKAIDNAGGTLIVNDLSKQNVNLATKHYKNAIGIVTTIKIKITSRYLSTKRLFYKTIYLFDLRKSLE